MPFLNRFSNRLLLIKNHDHRVPPIVQSYLLGGISFGTGSPSALESIIVDSSGNFYACGAMGNDCLVLKFNSSGTVLWQRNLSDGVTIRGKSIAVDTSGNVYVCASYSYAGNEQIRVFKLDSSGALVFKKGIYRGNNTTTTAESISVDSSGNIYICGSTDLNGYNFYFLKLNTSGTAITYQRHFGGTSSFDLASSLKLASGGNFYVAGSCGDSSIFGPLIGKYDNDGIRQWQRRLNTGTSSQVNLALDGDENVYASYIAIPTTGTITSDYGIAKYNTSGTIQWQKRLNSTTSSDEPASISVDAAGNIYMFGISTINGGSIDFFLVKLDSSGAILWQRTLGTDINSDEYGLEVALDSSGNIYITGYTFAYTAGGGGSSIFGKLPNDGSKTGTYSIAGGRSLIYASATSFTSPNTTFTDSSVTLTNATPGLTLFDSFETIATPSLSITVVTL